MSVKPKIPDNIPTQKIREPIHPDVMDKINRYGRKRSHDTPKSRLNYNIGICLKDCANRDKKCDNCVKWSGYKPICKQ